MKEKNKEEKSRIKIGIIGLGMVGTPIMKWFIVKGWERGKSLFCYDADPKKGYFDNVSEANIIFICVPTPPNPDGSCNTSIVESAVSQLPDRENRLDNCIISRRKPRDISFMTAIHFKSKRAAAFTSTLNLRPNTGG